MIELSDKVPEYLDGCRADIVAAELFSDYSRARLQKWLKSGLLQVNGKPVKVKDKLCSKDLIYGLIDEPLEEVWSAEAVDLDIVYEDDQIAVINKPAGLVVHPAAGNYQGTLLNGLLFRFPDIAKVPRAGIVHRLDKDTSGLLVVAKTLLAQHDLVKQLQARTMKRDYFCIARGQIDSDGHIDQPIGRHPKSRTKMAVVGGGKPAMTRYQVKQRFCDHTALSVQLQTGRTHQIRVHMAHIGHPLEGDPTYASRANQQKTNLNYSNSTAELIVQFPRQALHAQKLGLVHPVTNQPQSWQAALPDDFSRLYSALQSE